MTRAVTHPTENDSIWNQWKMSYYNSAFSGTMLIPAWCLIFCVNWYSSLISSSKCQGKDTQKIKAFFSCNVKTAYVHTNLHRFQMKERKRTFSSASPPTSLCQISLLWGQVLSPKKHWTKQIYMEEWGRGLFYVAE